MYGRMAAATTCGGSTFIWETATGTERLVLNRLGYATCVAFSPDGRLLASTGDDKTIKLWGIGSTAGIPSQPNALEAWIEDVTTAKVVEGGVLTP